MSPRHHRPGPCYDGFIRPDAVLSLIRLLIFDQVSSHTDIEAMSRCKDNWKHFPNSSNSSALRLTGYDLGCTDTPVKQRKHILSRHKLNIRTISACTTVGTEESYRKWPWQNRDSMCSFLPKWHHRTSEAHDAPRLFPIGREVQQS
jgi:hypothetical protein